jgi:glycosyltransferase involved in cell wall biosynthesis
MDTHLKGILAKWSIGAADVTVAPSEAFAHELRQWTGRKITSIHHGFDGEAFRADTSALPIAIQQQFSSKSSALRLLFVSHYNYYRNFETLFRAIPLIKRRLGSRPVALFLTCKLAAGANSGAYRTDSAAALVKELKVSSDVVELGAIPYRSLHHLYRSTDIYVTPAYAESFAHPLVESMSSALPVIASDIPVHREVCGAAALYFEPFSPERLAERVVELAQSPQLVDQLSKAGLERSDEFSWRSHVERILALANSLSSPQPSPTS